MVIIVPLFQIENRTRFRRRPELGAEVFAEFEGVGEEGGGDGGGLWEGIGLDLRGGEDGESGEELEQTHVC